MDRAVLMQMILRYDGSNNGKISISKKELKQELSAGDDSVLKSLEVLKGLGFIRKAKDGQWNSSKSKSKATEYTITFYHDHVNNLSPSNDWQNRNIFDVERVFANLKTVKGNEENPVEIKKIDDWDLDSEVPF
jgi:hypothetical protein